MKASEIIERISEFDPESEIGTLGPDGVLRDITDIYEEEGVVVLETDDE